MYMPGLLIMKQLMTSSRYQPRPWHSVALWRLLCLLLVAETHKTLAQGECATEDACMRAWLVKQCVKKVGMSLPACAGGHQAAGAASFWGASVLLKTLHQPTNLVCDLREELHGDQLYVTVVDQLATV
jgi:hypothetical protein